ncbi:MAG: LCP family protein, partial [Spirochaetaceae bacterium]|nr:LCP family protein [Spirochaetaceae bacterium]
RSGVSEEREFDPAVSFFDAFRFLVSNEAEETAAAEFTLYLADIGLEEYFTGKGYEFYRINYKNASVKMNGKVYLDLIYNSEDRNITFNDILGNTFIKSLDDESIISALDKEIALFNDYNRDIAETAGYLEGLKGKSEISVILAERELTIIRTDSDRFNILNNKDKSIIGFFGHDEKAPTLNGHKLESAEEFETALISFLENVSNLTESERIDALVLNKMESIFADEGFRLLLESNRCNTELSRREDEEFIYFDIHNDDGSVKGSYLLQKEFGEVLLISGDGKFLKSLKMFAPGNDFKSLIIPEEEIANVSPYAFDDSSETFLVVGTHEHNADTMIIVNANNKTGQIKMISFPRDLYYKGKKINNIYKVFGPERLCRELSEITGLKISKYVSIDMFAFVDVVNILGGIDVTLDEALIDPTYKVKNNGVWSTLHYREGTHHLDGVAALRVARSRHGSQAYDRSKRQQLIIKSVLDEMISLDGGDIGKMYSFVTSVFSYIDTNLSIANLVKDFLMYKDNVIADPNVISHDNILDVEYSNTYLLPEEEKIIAEKDPDTRGLWIVLPKNNDWNLFRKYIENILQ